LNDFVKSLKQTGSMSWNSVWLSYGQSLGRP